MAHLTRHTGAHPLSLGPPGAYHAQTVLVLVLVLIKDDLFIKRMLAPKGIRIPGLHSYVSGYNLTQENTCCLRLQRHLYPSMVATGLGRGDELRHSRRE